MEGGQQEKAGAQMNTAQRYRVMCLLGGLRCCLKPLTAGDILACRRWGPECTFSGMAGMGDPHLRTCIAQFGVSAELTIQGTKKSDTWLARPPFYFVSVS
jgi:hypothetical protein